MHTETDRNHNQIITQGIRLKDSVNQWFDQGMKTKYENPNTLVKLLQKVLCAGGNELEIEYRDQKEWFTAFKGLMGIGIGSLESDKAKPIFRAMKELKKKKSATINGLKYLLRFHQYESFGEMVYRIEMKEIGSNKQIQAIAAKRGSA